MVILNYYNKKFDWLFIVDPIWLVWNTYISHWLTDPSTHNILDAPTKRYFFFYKKITQKMLTLHSVDLFWCVVLLHGLCSGSVDFVNVHGYTCMSRECTCKLTCSLLCMVFGVEMTSMILLLPLYMFFSHFWKNASVVWICIRAVFFKLGTPKNLMRRVKVTVYPKWPSFVGAALWSYIWCKPK